jgi:RNA recognition motif-containing protein
VGNHDIFGFVQFMSCEDATAAQKQMNGRMVDGSYLKVSFANDRIALRSGHEKSMPPPRRMATPSEPTLTLDELRRRHRVRSVESRVGAEREPSRSSVEREPDVLVDSVSSMASPPPETSSDSLFVLVVPVNFKSDGKVRLDQLGQQIGNAIAACLQQS